MHVKLVVSTIISFVGITLALGYFGLSTTISGISEMATTTDELPPAPPADPLPPADPERPGFTLPEIVFPKFPLAPNTQPAPIIPTLTPTPVSPRVPPVTSAPVVPEPSYPVTPVAPSTPAPKPDEDEEEYAGDARSFAEGALVNILCSSTGSPLKKSISGSGVIIDSRGIIITVAHVGHYFLLEDYPEPGSSDCIIRTGSPAKNAYDAKLIYVSPDWVRANASALAQAAPRGNGENDFAFLAITESITNKKLPVSFTAVPLASDAPEEGDTVGIGSYGAEFLSGREIISSLFPIIDDGEVADIYTYGSREADVISVRGSKAAQSGSSGGGVVNTSGRFIGLISTSSLVGETAQRTFYAITPGHIRASFRDDTGNNLDSYLRSSLSTLIAGFEDEKEELAEVVWEAIF
jgi:hypothetical protein